MTDIHSDARHFHRDATWCAAISAAANAFREVAAERLRQRRVYQQTLRELQSLSTREINELGLDTSLFEQWAREKARVRPKSGYEAKQDF